MQVGNVVSLFSWVVLSINDFNFKTKRFSLSLNTFFHSYEEWVVQCGNREADRAGLFCRRRYQRFYHSLLQDR